MIFRPRSRATAENCTPTSMLPCGPVGSMETTIPSMGPTAPLPESK